MSLIDSTLEKIKDNAVTKAKKTVVSSITKKFDSVYPDAVNALNTASGIVADEGANEAAKRFEMYQTHTNRPKNSQQFYVLFHPRNAGNDLIYLDMQGGKEGTPSGLMSDLKAWGKQKLDAGKNYIKSMWTSTDPETGEEKSNTPGWMKSIGDGVTSAVKGVKDTVQSVSDAVVGAYNKAKDAYKSAEQWVRNTRDYIFGTSGSPATNQLFQPVEYYPMSSGWLSEFCQSASPRARIIEFGLFFDDSTQALQKVCDEISMHCVDTDRPSWEMPVTRYNQYNRDRLVYEKVRWKPVRMTFYDTIDSALIKLLIFQLAFISDSYLKEFRHFKEYTQLENFLNNPGNWGMNLYSNVGIFDAISLVEIWGDQCTVYNLQQPKITSVELSRADASKSDVHKITITFEHEGMTNINPITMESGGYDIMLAWAMSDSDKAAKIAEKCRMRYESSVQAFANLAKDFYVSDGSIMDKIQNLGERAGFGSEMKLANELYDAAKTGNWGSVGKQLVNPSSITSKIGRLF